ncbi:SusC/RagA family TonB-linked outer membrane protein [Flavobacterium sp. FPG59]|jgi:iron complex outermembrane receptor protein|uniref:SusC/RagA family TonB-linked outer membrane protein n=1 Tax=Flavobacterium sp. FPG59 TaxID=1929267 RepID=UPI000A35FBC2|nr:SusC/RagA family TonB-linked outer membrane protein [Flavobacterium sp. FPG59]OUD37620.1 SusC/RagA family TonB-linked outer membrane protein [Flavobacterium sp. FPG59]
MKTIYKKLLILVLLLPFSILAQSTVSGTVVDKTTGQPFPGVNVNVQGVKNGVSTDYEGKYQLNNVKAGDKIVYSFIGYTTAVVEYLSQKTVNVSLQEDANQLKEVVVQVGYGTVKKKDATGAVTVLGTKDFNKGANVTAENLLNGRVAGVTVNTSGAPGSGSQIRIRGGSSLFASNDPLIVIDGLPIENNSDKNFGSTSILASINPSTIESMTVLKDASATAIYGSRASNGVIIITTKKGSKNLAVDYNFQYGSGSLDKTIPVFNADQFRALIADKRPSDLSKLGTANTDWQKAIYRRTDYVDNNVSIRGNLFNTIPTRLTIGNTYQEGLRLTNTFNRNTIGLALNPSFLKDHLRIKLNANYANEKNRFAEGVEGSAIRFDPTQPIYSAGSIYGGFFEYYNRNDNKLLPQTPRNPVAQLLQTFDKGLNNRIFGNFEVDYKFHFMPALRAVVNAGYDQADGERSKVASLFAASSGSNDNIPFGTNEFSRSERKNKLLDAYLVYNNTYKDLVYDVTAGYSYQKWDSFNYVKGNTNDPNLPTGPTGFPQTTIDFDRVNIGFFGRSNLNFKDKYLLTLSYRRDGSSRFDKDNRWANFPAAAFAWKIKEDLLSNNTTVSDLKLRVGYGITGQQEIGNNNDYLQQYNLGSGSSQYFFGTVALPIAVSARQSANLKWEETTTYNAGLDFGLYGNRITGSVEVFYKDSKDLLAEVATADGGNFSNRSWQNIGSFTTKGLEFSLSTDVVRTDDVNWNLNFNATSFERKLTSLNPVSIFVGDNLAGTGTQGQVHQVGFAPNSFLLYKQLYDANSRPIEGAYQDFNNDGIINADDKYVYRNPDPKAVFGFASTLNYKNLDFSFNLRASVGNRVFNAVNAARAQYRQLVPDSQLGNIPTSVLDTDFTTTSNVVLSDLFVENASFLRMDNITLGYTFPKWLEGKASLRLFAGMQNVFVISDYSGLDPEVANNGVDNTIYPRQRSILGGVNVKF